MENGPSCRKIWLLIGGSLSQADLHDSDCAECDSEPVDGPDAEATKHDGADALSHLLKRIERDDHDATAWVSDTVSVSALGTRHLGRHVAFLLLKHPPLDAGLVDPLGCSATPATTWYIVKSTSPPKK